jgi:drug/metabolite transporter (DMT)-like permease
MTEAQPRRQLMWLATGLLVLVTVVWGTTFPITKEAVAELSPSTIIATRFWVAAVVMLPFLLGVWTKSPETGQHRLNTSLLYDGALVGAVLFVSYITQVIGLTTVSSNRAAFITGLNVVLVPLLGPLLGKIIPRPAWIAASIAVLGIAVLSFEGGSIGSGDAWVLGCTISYALYILLLDRVTHRHAPLALTAVQVLVVALLGSVWVLFEVAGVQWASLWQAMPQLVYLGVAATALATFLQAFGQRFVSATNTAVIYALEPVFAAMFAYLWLAETLGWRGFLGAGLILVAMVYSQWPGSS